MRTTEIISSAIESCANENDSDVCKWKLCWWERQRCLQLKALLMRTTEMSIIESSADENERDVYNWKLYWWERQRCLQLKALLMRTRERERCLHIESSAAENIEMSATESFADENNRNVCNWKLCWWERRGVCNWKLCWWEQQRCLQLKALLMRTREMSTIESSANENERGVCN